MNILLFVLLSIFIGVGVDTFYPSRKNLNVVKVVMFSFAACIIGSLLVSIAFEKDFLKQTLDLQVLMGALLFSLLSTYFLKKSLSEGEE